MNSKKDIQSDLIFILKKLLEKQKITQDEHDRALYKVLKRDY